MKSRTAITALLISMAAPSIQAQPTFAWRYYRPSNTGIQGDNCEALWIAPDQNPWIAGYDASFEEGGIAKFIQSENRWINLSNVDHQVIGHPEDTGTSRVSDIVADASGKLWMATGRGALVFDPAIGPSSLIKYGPSNSGMPGGWCEDVDIAPDGTIWFASRAVVWGDGGVSRYNPATSSWTSWPDGAELLSIRPTPGGGYTVWTNTGNNGLIRVFDSATQLWTTPPYSGSAGQIASLPGKDCTDEAGNFWALRATTPGSPNRLEYQRPDGSWVTPPEPIASLEPGVFHAFGDRQALMVDGGGRVWRFDGAAWIDLGQWRPGPFSSAVDMDASGNVWVCGVGGAARRDALTGQWQRYRITNTSQYDFFNNDLTIDPATGDVYACANAGPGYGGMVKFDGARWIGYNNETYGLGQPWPFNTDNSETLYFRPDGQLVANPTFAGTHQLTGSSWAPLPGGSGTVRGYTEDSLGRLWGLGEYFSLGIYGNGAFTNHSIAAWGQRIQPDPDRAGTVWANAGYEVVRTDGVYRFSRTIDDFPELTSQSDTFSGLAVDHNGIAWLGCTVQFGAGGTGGGLIRLDSNTGAYTMLRHGETWPFPGQFVQPLAVTPDGKVWMQYDSDFLTAQRGLCWYDGTNVGVFPAPSGGEPQWGGLPHAGIKELEVRILPDGYELWMSCLSRGIAVLKVTNRCPADFNSSGSVTVQDIFDFLSAYFTSSPTADVNTSGSVTVQDIFDFLNAYFAGCP